MTRRKKSPENVPLDLLVRILPRNVYGFQDTSIFMLSLSFINGILYSIQCTHIKLMPLPCCAYIYKILTGALIGIFSWLMFLRSSEDIVVIITRMEKKLDVSVVAQCDITKATVGGIYYCVNAGHW